MRARTRRWSYLGLLIVAMQATAAAALTEPLRLVMPIACELGRVCLIQNYVAHGAPGPRDYRCGSITYPGHNGTDFRVPDLAAQRAGIAVLAAADGRVMRVRDGMADRFAETLAPSGVEGRECGNGVVVAHADEWETQYCHLARDSVIVKAGDQVVAGQPIGRVGFSGLAQFPHVHLTVRQKGVVVDPFAYGAPEGSCGGGTSLWSAEVQAALFYRPRSVLNIGFAAKPLTMAMVEAGEASAAVRRADAPALVAYVRAISLKAGDVQRLVLTAPDGNVLADHTEPPLDRDKAQSLMFTGVRRPPGGWTEGTYTNSRIV